MKIEKRKLDSIKPYEKNPRNNDRAVDSVASSIKEFGFRSPIIVDKKGVIIAGHTRYKAAQKLGMTEVPCVIAADLTKAQIKAYRLADNKTAELAEWDFAMLHDELEELTKDLDFDMQDFGFYVADIPDFDEIFHSQPEERPKPAAPDNQQQAENAPVEASESDSEGEDIFTVIVMLPSFEDAQTLAETLQKDGYDCKVGATV